MSQIQETIKLLRTMDTDQLIEMFMDLADSQLLEDIKDAATFVIDAYKEMEEREAEVDDNVDPDHEHILADNKQRLV